MTSPQALEIRASTCLRGHYSASRIYQGCGSSFIPSFIRFIHSSSGPVFRQSLAGEGGSSFPGENQRLPCPAPTPSCPAAAPLPLVSWLGHCITAHVDTHVHVPLGLSLSAGGGNQYNLLLTWQLSQRNFSVPGTSCAFALCQPEGWASYPLYRNGRLREAKRLARGHTERTWQTGSEI